MEIDLGGKDTFTAAEVQALVTKQVDTLVQPKIDSIVTSRLAQQARKYENYDELVLFKTEHENKTAADEQVRLEAAGKYEEALKANNAKLEELSGVIQSKDTAINSMKINNALTNEIVKQGGYLEESLAMLNASAQLKDGIVVIKGKDANGLDKDFAVTDGVKSFLEGRPHLVKTNVNAGGGDSGAGVGSAGNGSAGEGSDLTSLNALLTKQIYANDGKGIQDTKAKIRALATQQGITLGGTIA